MHKNLDKRNEGCQNDACMEKIGRRGMQIKDIGDLHIIMISDADSTYFAPCSPCIRCMKKT